MSEAQRYARFWAAIPGWARWRRLGLALLIGIVIALGQEVAQGGFVLVIVGLVLAFRGTQHLTPRQAVWFGWAVGLGYFGLTLRWIIEPFLVDPERHGWMAPFGLLGLAGGMAIYWALAFGFAARLAAQPGPRFTLLTASICLTELARAHLFSGFPWALPSYALIGTPADFLLAWTGPHGATLFLAAIAGIAAYCFHRGWTLVWPGFMVPFFGLLGLAYLTPLAPGMREGATVRLVQPNAPQHQKWDPEWIPVFFDRAIEATRADPPPDLVIWPETSVATLLNHADPWLAEMARAARGAPVVAGLQRYQEEIGYHNSLIVMEGDGSVREVYDKRHLVPFGEYVPLGWVFGWAGLASLADMASGFAAGTAPGTFDIPGLGRTRVLICYEGIFPEEIIEDGPRPDALLIITNDAWFGTGPGPRQHLVQARARAIEFGLPVIRVANTGISAVIDARGDIVASLPLNTGGHLDSAVPAALPPTPYARMGDWPVVLLLCVVSLGGAIAGRRFQIDRGGAGG